MSDTLLDQADALMRRRSFVAGARSESAPPAEPAMTQADGGSEDVPLLTEVVDLTGPLPHNDEAPSLGTAVSTNAQIEQAAHDRLNQVLVERSAELSREIETWLDEQMPQLVIRAMDGITDHLVALLANRARDELLPRLEAALRHTDEDAASNGE